MPTSKSLVGRVLQILEMAILASLVAGVVIGVLARLAMTALTLGGGMSDTFSPLTFTLLGTIRIVTVPMLFGIPIALLIVAIWRYLPELGWAKVISAGVVTFVFPGLLLLTDDSFKLNNANQYLGIALFAPLYFGYGFLVGCIIDYLNKRIATNIAVANDMWTQWKKAILPASLVILAILFVWSDSVTFSR